MDGYRGPETFPDIRISDGTARTTGTIRPCHPEQLTDLCHRANAEPWRAARAHGGFQHFRIFSWADLTAAPGRRPGCVVTIVA